MATLEEWYKSIPVVTRTYLTLCALTALAVHLEFVSPLALYLNFNQIAKNYEYWRLLTTFLFFDYFGLNFLFHMYFTVQHSRRLEESSFRGRTGDYFFLFLFGAVCLISIQYFMYLFPAFAPKNMLLFLAPSLSFMIVYVWSRRNRNVRMNFLGLFTFTAPYLPWVILGFGYILHQQAIYDVLGIAVGHVYYFLEDVYPEITGRRLLKTPGFIKQLFGQQQDVPDMVVRQPQDEHED
eukprot:TRINITY_DN6858_c0_g1_i1.p1 TRINITY_DN6858_c0_g1~~TRINITY_DN6858_c0_g1_i1.p1  ORF type:complete len:237 (+),score=36.14 TRINITY_DN6858_c0_g1_i1:155-865(+)